MSKSDKFKSKAAADNEPCIANEPWSGTEPCDEQSELELGKAISERAKKTSKRASDKAYKALELYNQARLYQQNSGSENNMSMAIVSYSAAAMLGSSMAAYELGRLYHKGTDGIKQNLRLAYEWYNKAKQLGGEGGAAARAEIESGEWDAYNEE